MQLKLPCYTWVMKPPHFIRPLTDGERRHLEADRRTADACRVRRAQIVLASAQRLSPEPIAQVVGCSVQTVRNVSMPFTRRAWRVWRSSRPVRRRLRRCWTQPSVIATHITCPRPPLCRGRQYCLEEAPRAEFSCRRCGGSACGLSSGDIYGHLMCGIVRRGVSLGGDASTHCL